MQKRHSFLDASLSIELRMVPRVRIELTTCGLGIRLLASVGGCQGPWLSTIGGHRVRSRLPPSADVHPRWCQIGYQAGPLAVDRG